MAHHLASPSYHHRLRCIACLWGNIPAPRSDESPSCCVVLGDVRASVLNEVPPVRPRLSETPVHLCCTHAAHIYHRQLPRTITRTDNTTNNHADLRYIL